MNLVSLMLCLVASPKIAEFFSNFILVSERERSKTNEEPWSLRLEGVDGVGVFKELQAIHVRVLSLGSSVLR